MSIGMSPDYGRERERPASEWDYIESHMRRVHWHRARIEEAEAKRTACGFCGQPGGTWCVFESQYLCDECNVWEDNDGE